MRKGLIIGMLLATSIVFAGCSSDATTETSEDIVEEGVAVKVQPVENDTVYENFYGVGSLKAESEYAVKAEQSGTVKEIYVNVGDHVEAGQVLMEIENATLVREVSNSVTSLKTSLDSARLALATAQETYDQTMVIFATGGVSANDVKTATTALEQAKLTYNSANENYRLTAETEQEKVADTEIKSPITGVVAASYVSLGQEVNGDTVFKVINDEMMIATVEVTSQAVRAIEAGSKADVYPNGDKSLGIKGMVTDINEVTGEKNYMYPVEVQLANVDDQLRSGDYVEVKIILEERENAIVIPKKAVLNILEKPQVYINNNGIAELRDVELGYTSNETIEILNGLSLGESLITQGHNFLENGMALKLPETEEE